MDKIKYCNNCLLDTNIKYTCAFSDCNHNICLTCYNTSYSKCILTNRWFCNKHIEQHELKKYFNYNIYSYWS